MRNPHSSIPTVHQRTTEALARLIRAQQARVDALLCACGAVGLFYADDDTLVCAACYEALLEASE